jgi:hypothetical protein
MNIRQSVIGEVAIRTANTPAVSGIDIEARRERSGKPEPAEADDKEASDVNAA